jgi:putative acetyltransferase
MRIRSATNADADAVRALVFGVLEEYGLKAEHEGVDADLDDLEATYINRGGIFEVIEDDDGHMIGTVGLFPKGDRVCELRKMYLVKQSRGKGLGRMIMDRVLDHARRLGLRRIELETAAVLVEAIDMYTRYGFRPIDPADVCARCDKAFALDLE